MAKLKFISPGEIPPRGKPFHYKFHKKIEKLLRSAGFKIEKSDPYAVGADIIASAEGNRIIVQCKCAKDKGTPYPRLPSLIDEYITKVEKEAAQVAILPMGNYSISSEYQELNKKEELLKSKIVIWDDKEIQYYEMLVGALKEWAKYPLLGDLGCKEEFTPPLRLSVTKVKQGNVEFCVFSISPEILLKIADVFRRIRDPKAYQRMVNKSRVKNEIKEYLEGPKPFFPTNLVCVFKEEVTFDDKTNTLKIPMKYSSVWIVDGQHRLYGFCHTRPSIRQNFELICSGFNISGLENSILKETDQAEMFAIINEKAKRVPKDLLIDIALKTRTADRRMKIVNKLKSSRVFRNKIKSVDTQGEIHITTFVFTSPMRGLVGDKETTGYSSKWYGRRVKEKIILPEEEDDFINFCVKKFEYYFGIAKEVFGDKWGKPDEYIVATDRGIRGLLRIMEHVLDYSRGLKDINKARNCFEALRDFDFRTSALRRMYLGEGGADELAYRLIGKIKEKYPDFGPQPSGIDEKQIEPGQRDLAEEFINKYLSKFDGEVWGELPYIDSTTFKYLSFIPPHCPIRIFIHGPKDPKTLKEARSLGEKRARVEIKKIRRLDDGAFIHDRWLSDGNIMVEFGQDLKNESLGKSRHNITVRDNAKFAPPLITCRRNWESSQEELASKGGKWELYFKS
ncbi:hypothetical protein ES706_03509 [subsurface metagenome]